MPNKTDKKKQTRGENKRVDILISKKKLDNVASLRSKKSQDIESNIKRYEKEKEENLEIIKKEIDSRKTFMNWLLCRNKNVKYSDEEKISFSSTILQKYNSNKGVGQSFKNYVIDLHSSDEVIGKSVLKTIKDLGLHDNNYNNEENITRLNKLFKNAEEIFGKKPHEIVVPLIREIKTQGFHDLNLIDAIYNDSAYNDDQKVRRECEDIIKNIDLRAIKNNDDSDTESRKSSISIEDDVEEKKNFTVDYLIEIAKGGNTETMIKVLKDKNVQKELEEDEEKRKKFLEAVGETSKNIPDKKIRKLIKDLQKICKQSDKEKEEGIGTKVIKLLGEIILLLLKIVLARAKEEAEKRETDASKEPVIGKKDSSIKLE